jgi:hypothetical protein
MQSLKIFLSLFMMIFLGIITWGFNRIARASESNLVIERFPAQVGNSWEYRRIYYTFTYNTSYADTSVELILDSLHAGFQGVDTVNNWETYRYELTLYEQSDTFLETRWYAHPDTAFLWVASYGTALGPPDKSIEKIRFKLGDMYFASLNDLKLFLFQRRGFYSDGLQSITGIFDPPKKLFVFPLSVGKIWIALTNPWLEEREALDENYVVVPGGGFQALRVEIKPQITGIDWYQWIADRGIVKESLYVRGIVMTDFSFDTLGYMDVSEKYELLDHKMDVDESSVGNSFPKDFSLNQNIPNPFNPTTTICFSVVGSGFMVHGPFHTTLKIYNILGQLVRTLVNEEKAPGNYKVIWDGKDDSGKEVASGIYFYQLKTKDYTDTKKMVLLR